MTLKALTTACNQSTNRDPVVDYEPRLVEATVLALKAKGLARVVHPGAGERATKYRQVADEALLLAPDEQAVLCVLLLRGAQTASELKTRTERLHRFASPGQVEATLQRLAERTPVAAAQLDRQPGQKESRWIQLFEADVPGRAAAAANSRSSSASSIRSVGRIEELETRVEILESQYSALVAQLGDLVDVSDRPRDDPEP